MDIALIVSGARAPLALLFSRRFLFLLTHSFIPTYAFSFGEPHHRYVIV